METEDFFDLRVRGVVPDLPIGLVNPSKNAGLQLKVVKQPYIETTSVPATPVNDVGQLGVNLRKTSQSPVDKFVEGEVTYTTKKGLTEMVQALPSLQDSSSHGCIVQEGLRPDGCRYEKGIHYLEQEEIGRGSYGSVKRCIDTNSYKTFVIKRMKKMQNGEVIVPLNLEHRNLARVYGLIQQPTPEGEVSLELLLEDAGMSLNRYMESYSVCEAEIWSMAKQGLLGLEHLHLFGMIHLDIKPENTCVQKYNGSLRLVIVDFGSAKLPHEKLMFLGWTPEYMSSERCKLFLQARGMKNYGIDESAITSKTDVFGFALVIMYMYKKYHILQKVITHGYTSYRHFNDNTRLELQMRLMKELAENPDFVTSLIPDECDLDMRDLLIGMTRHDPRERLDTVGARKAVEERDNRIVVARFENQLKVQRSKNLSIKQASDLRNTRNFFTSGEIPEMANDVQDFETGPIKSATKDRLRMKLQKPYSKKNQAGEQGSSINKGHPLASKKLEGLGSPMEVNAELRELSEKFASPPDLVELGLVPREKGPVAETQAHEQSVMETGRSPVIQTEDAMEPEHRVPVVVSHPVDRTEGPVADLRRRGLVKTPAPVSIATGPAQLTQAQLIQLLLAHSVNIQQQAAQFIPVSEQQQDFIDLSAREGAEVGVEESHGNIPDFSII